MNLTHGQPKAAAPRSGLVIATRGSMLALWQADYVTGLLAKLGHQAEKLILKTTADRVQDRFLHEIGGKGLFVRELEEALVDGRADLAVHSLKDMTATLPPTFALGAVLTRHRPTDVMIFNPKVMLRLQATFLGPEKTELTEKMVATLPALRVGTGSLRRQAIFKRVAPQLSLVGIRGNVDTRLKKLEAGEWDAIVLAEASLERLGLLGVPHRRLAANWFIPSSAQGALAIECLAANAKILQILASLACVKTTRAVTVERGVLAALGGDCQLPFGCHVHETLDPSGVAKLNGHAAVFGLTGERAEATHDILLTPAANALNEKQVIARFITTLVTKLGQAGAGPILRGLGMTPPAALL